MEEGAASGRLLFLPCGYSRRLDTVAVAYLTFKTKETLVNILSQKSLIKNHGSLHTSKIKPSRRQHEMAESSRPFTSDVDSPGKKVGEMPLHRFDRHNQGLSPASVPAAMIRYPVGVRTIETVTEHINTPKSFRQLAFLSFLIQVHLKPLNNLFD